MSARPSDETRSEDPSGAGDPLTALGYTLLVTATGTDSYGNEVALGSVAWASTDPTIASVVGGIVVAHDEGTVEITATAGGRADKGFTASTA